jgi:hypothetical protein
MTDQNMDQGQLDREIEKARIEYNIATYRGKLLQLRQGYLENQKKLLHMRELEDKIAECELQLADL